MRDAFDGVLDVIARKQERVSRGHAPVASRGRSSSESPTSTTAALVGLGVFVALPARWWPVDAGAAALIVRPACGRRGASAARALGRAGRARDRGGSRSPWGSSR